MANETPIYNLEELSERLNISVRTLRLYINQGKLKASFIGRSYFVTEPNLMAFIEDNELLDD